MKQENLQHVGTHCKCKNRTSPQWGQEDLILGTNSGMKNLLERLPPYLPMCRKLTDNWKTLKQSSVLLFYNNNYTTAARNWMGPGIIILTRITDLSRHLHSEEELWIRTHRAHNAINTSRFGWYRCVSAVRRCCQFWQACWVAATGICQMLPTHGPCPARRADLLLGGFVLKFYWTRYKYQLATCDVSQRKGKA